MDLFITCMLHKQTFFPFIFTKEFRDSTFSINQQKQPKKMYYILVWITNFIYYFGLFLSVSYIYIYNFFFLNNLSSYLYKIETLIEIPNFMTDL